MSLADLDPALVAVDRWLDRRDAAGFALRAALEALAGRFLDRWSLHAPPPTVEKVRAALVARELAGLAHALPQRANQVTGDGSLAGVVRVTRATDLLTQMTAASGAEAFEAVEQAFRRSLSRLGARFVVRHARAAIDDDMGPMHSTVVAADLFAMLEKLDAAYLEALTYALETMRDWGTVAPAGEPKAANPRSKKARPLSPPKRRA